MKRDPKARPKIGRPSSAAAESHAAIMDAVYALLQEGSAKDLSMEAIAKKAKVGKPTLYKWWPSKAALIMAMFHERLVVDVKAPPAAATAEAALRTTMRRLIKGLNGLFGKVLADLITEGQSDPAVLRDLFEGHIKVRQAADIAAIERGKEKGELATDANADLVINAIFGSLVYRLLLRLPITEKYGDELIDTVLRGIQPRNQGLAL
jgi:AcrR family transcriptional regulator